MRDTIDYFETVVGGFATCFCCGAQIKEGVDFDSNSQEETSLCLDCASRIGRKAQLGREARLREFPSQDIPDDTNHY